MIGEMQAFPEIEILEGEGTDKHSIG